MDYLSFFINKISLEVDFYNNEAYAGNSILPFMGFMMFLIGLVVVIVGAATDRKSTRLNSSHAR